jgi:MFS family permease
MTSLKLRDRSAYIRLIGVLFLVFGASGLTAPLLSNYIQVLGADTSQIGLVFAVFQTASLASQYWWGQRSDRLGRRKPLVLIGTAGLTLAFLGSAAAPNYQVLYITRILEGLAFAAYSTGSLALIGDLLEDQQQRGRMMGFYRMFGSLAFAGTALAGGWLADSFGLRIPVALSAGCFALACILVLSIRETPAAPAMPSAAGVPEQAAPTNWRILGPFLGLTFAWFVGMGSVISLWPVFMHGQGYSQTQISGLWALAAAGEVLWLFVAGVLADRIGRKWVIVTGVAGMACIYAAYTFAPSFVWFLPIQIIRSFTYSCFETPALLYATELGLRKQRGRLAGLYYSASGIGGIAGSALGGAAAQAFGMAPMFRAAALVLLLAALAAAIVMPGKIAAPLLQQQEAKAPGM